MEQHTTRKLSLPDGSSDEDAAYSLLVMSGGVTSTYPLGPDGRFLIGRAPHAEIRVDHSSVSREHARIVVGEELEIEDLGSANGTRVRGVPLRPGTPRRVVANDVIDLGEVLLVVQCRRLEQGLTRVCSPAFFELRLEEECDRARGNSHGVTLVRLRIQGELGAHAVELLIASELRAAELVCCSAPGQYEILLFEPAPALSEARVTELGAHLRSRGLEFESRLRSQPRDGTDAASLLEKRATKSGPPRHGSAHPGLVAEDPGMLRVCRLLERVAASELGVVLLGETGVGKEMCAELLHRESPRKDGKFLRLNCAALVESLLESELFGHERGAFTGALGEKAGLLESASGGSIFLDEVGDMPLTTQVKLLRVLEAKEVLRIGSVSPRPLDVRVIAATNRNLQERITAGLFREDLFYRLNGISVLVPPLRERPLDIEPLARHFVRLSCKDSPAPRFSESALSFLRAQRWPGNVRELKNTVERALVLCDGTSIEPEHLTDPALAAGSSRLSGAEGLRGEVEALERERIERALREAGGSQRKAAQLLGISRGALLRRIAQYDLARSRKGG